MRAATGIGLGVAVVLGGFMVACGSDDRGSSGAGQTDGGGGKGEAGGASNPGAGGRGAATGGTAGKAGGGGGGANDGGRGGANHGGAGGANDGGNGGASPDPFVRSSLARTPSDSVDAQSVTDAVRGNEALAFDLYSALRAEPGNLFFSPFSITSALAMAWAGARGATASEMATALHFGEPAATHAGLGALEQRLVVETTDLVVQNANALWILPELAPLGAFLDVLAVNYGAGVGPADFSNPAAAADLIDAWVAGRTRNTIPRLLEAGDLDNAKAVLTNALYFKGLWSHPFGKESTAPAPFHRADGATPSVEFMHTTASVGYVQGADYQAASLPYVAAGARRYEMVVVLPAGPLAGWEADLDPAKFDAVVDALVPQDVELALPRFEMRSALSLKAVLSGLGMPTAFGDADFSGLSEPPPGHVSDVIHQAFVSVDEGGTVAAGATAVVFADGGAVFRDAPPPALTLDRPFLVAVRSVDTGALLFVGRVSEP